MVLVALACALTGASLAGAVVVDFFDSAAAPEALLSEMALHPAAMRVGDVTYIAYQGAGYDPFVAAYDESEGTWSGPVRAGINPLVLDTHGAPSMYLDAAGRLNLIYGGHNRPLYHSRTVEPGDISAWEALPLVDSMATYPQTFVAHGGRVVLFYRTTNNNWVMRISDEDRVSFGAPETILLGGPDTWWYADFRPGSGGNIHAAFVWNDYLARLDGRPYARRHVYYMRRDPGGTWHDATGTPVPVPLDRTAADASVRVIDSGEQLVNEISVKEDDTGAPCILFVTGYEAGPDQFAWHYLRRESDEWTDTTITTTDHFFDSGAFMPAEDGSVEAFLVAGDSDAVGSENGNPRGRGGAIERWLSADRGLTWSRESTITPDEPASLFGDPQFVVDGSGRARLVFTEWTNDDTSFFNRMYLWGDEGLVTREVEPAVRRLAGARRADTAVSISRTAFPEGARTVVIAREDDFPDALAGASLAHAFHAPLLLASPDGVSAATREEIVRLGATRAVLLGGAAALGRQVELDLFGSTTVTYLERLAGANRYETSRAIAARLRLLDPNAPRDSAFVVSGENWPDATSVAPLAATAGVPIVLVRASSVPSASADVLAAWDVTQTVVVGGEAVISPEVLEQLPSPVRVAGANRYETSEAVARYGLATTLLPYRATLATGRAFPDALTGAGLAARLRAPVLLTAPTSLSPPAAAYLKDVADRTIATYVFGSSGAIGDGVLAEVSKLRE